MYKECLIIVLALESQFNNRTNDTKFQQNEKDILNLKEAFNILKNTIINIYHKTREASRKLTNFDDISVTLLISQNNSVIYGETSHISQEIKQILGQSFSNSEVQLENCDNFGEQDERTDYKDLSADSNHTDLDFLNSEDLLVSSITLVEPKLEVLEDNVKVENDDEYIDELNAGSNLDADIEQDDKDEEVSDDEGHIPNNSKGKMSQQKENAKFRTCGVSDCAACTADPCRICSACKNKKRCLLRMCAGYKRVLKEKHSRTNKYTCERCSVKFTSVWNLTRHLQKKVCMTDPKSKYGEYPVVCQECQTFSINIKEFKNHKKTTQHTKFKYQCIRCQPMQLVWPKKMSRHVHREIKGERNQGN